MYRRVYMLRVDLEGPAVAGSGGSRLSVTRSGGWGSAYGLPAAFRRRTRSGSGSRTCSVSTIARIRRMDSSPDGGCSGTRRRCNRHVMCLPDVGEPAASDRCVSLRPARNRELAVAAADGNMEPVRLTRLGLGLALDLLEILSLRMGPAAPAQLQPSSSRPAEQGDGSFPLLGEGMLLR